MLLRIIGVILVILLLMPAYATMSGNALWLWKDKDSWGYFGANKTLRNLPINDGESFEIEYDVYVEHYESDPKWAPLAIVQVHLNASTVNSNDNKYYTIDLFNDGTDSGLYLQSPDASSDKIETDNASKYDSLDAWIGKEHRVKLEVKKINSTNFEVNYYIDGDLVGKWNTSLIANNDKWENYSFDEVCCGIGFTLGGSNPNNSFKMAIDNLRIKLPNGTVIEEDFEDNDWNRIFGRQSFGGVYADYGIGPAPGQPIRTPIPLGAVIATYTFMLFIVLRIVLRKR